MTEFAIGMVERVTIYCFMQNMACLSPNVQPKCFIVNKCMVAKGSQPIAYDWQKYSQV